MRKKLFAVIMSVMMMVTFMPAMAFADEKPEQVWSSDFSTLTMNNIVYPAAKTFNNNGSITATANGKTATYWDFTGASIVSYNNSTEQLVNMDYDSYLNMIDQTSTVEAPKFKKKADGTKYTVADLLGGSGTYRAYVKFKKPEDVDAQTPGTKVGYTLLSTLDIDPEVELQKYEPYEDVKSLTFPVAFTPKSLPKTEYYTGDTKNCGGVINTEKAVKDHKVYLQMPEYPAHVTYTMEGLDPAETYQLNMASTVNHELSAPYCGENQNLTITAKNITAKFRDVLSTEYTDAAPEMINVKENGYKFYIQLYRGTDKLGTETLYKVNVTRAPLAIQFQKSNFNFLAGTKVKASDLFELKTVKAKSVVDVFEADKAEAAKLFETLAAVGFDANSFPTQGTTEITLPYGYIETATSTHARRNRTSDIIDVDAICYELGNLMKTDADALNFLNNYQFANNEYTQFNGKFRTAAQVNYGVLYNDVTAPNQTRTFHVKKAKALKSKKTIQLKATADYGTMSFTKMSVNKKGSYFKVSKDGKVTVKKGLKKGTYVVKVKVKAPGAAAIKKLTVRVVK